MDREPKRAPDLLFEDERDARALEIAPLLEAPERVSAAMPLHRLTVFLTYRCNLACPYCKTIARSEGELEARPQKRRSYDRAAFEALLDGHSGTVMRHLHLTGGEAATVPGLAEMVRAARARGVEAVSLTSNGTLAPALYLGLLEAGLTELRISLDANEAALCEQLTGRKGALGAVVRTLAALVQARARGARFTLIINTVVGMANRAALPQLLSFFLRFRPDDVKLITEVDVNQTLGAFAGAARVRAELQALLSALPAKAMPLLRRKLETVFARDAIGLERAAAAGAGNWRCYIPLTERTVDRESYYPCSVYLREGGAPLGPLTDGPEVQRQRSAAFVRDSDCLVDPICHRYCLHCTRSFNQRANEART